MEDLCRTATGTIIPPGYGAIVVNALPINGTEKLYYIITTDDGVEMYEWDGEKYVAVTPTPTGSLTITKNGTYDVSGYATVVVATPVVYTDEILDDWSTIVSAVEDGSATKRYLVGSYKTLDLGEEGSVIMRVVAHNTDALADGSGNASLTFVSEELLAISHIYNPALDGNTEGTGAIGGWGASSLRAYIKETVRPLLPDSVRGALKEVKKYSRSYNTSGTIVANEVTNDDVWIPSRREIGLTGNAETSGPVYSDIYTTQASRIKRVAGTAESWWLRTVAGSTATVCFIQANGEINGTTTATGRFISLGFCL